MAYCISAVLESRTIDQNEYCRHIASCLVRDYIFANSGEWPSNWQDLRPEFNVRFSNISPRDFDALTKFIDLDFTIDPTRLPEIANEPVLSSEFEPIKARFGDNVQYELDPNQLILEIFR